MILQAFNHLFKGSTAQSFLLNVAPLIGFGWTARLCRRSQVFADMEEVAQKGALVAENLPCLTTYPIGAIAHNVNAAVQSPSRRFGAVAPAPPGLFNRAEGGGVDRCGAAFGLAGDQSHFLPFPWPFISAFCRLHGADHGAVGLGNYIWLTLSRQQPEGLFILFLELGLSSLSVFQGAVVNAGGSNFDAIVLEDALGCSRKGMFAAEVGEHPLQTKGSPPWSDADSLGKDTQVVRAQVAPDLFAHRDFPKDRAPFQRFFLRLRTVGSLALSSSATR